MWIAASGPRKKQTAKPHFQNPRQQETTPKVGLLATFVGLLSFLEHSDQAPRPEATENNGKDEDGERVLAALAGALFLTGLVKSLNERPLRSSVQILLALGLALAIVGVAYACVLSVLSWPYIVAILWPHLQPMLDSLVGRIVLVATLAGLAIGLYFIKGKWPIAYGIAGFSVGVSLCWVTLGNRGYSAMTAAMTLAAGVYLMVRSIKYLPHRGLEKLR